MNYEYRFTRAGFHYIVGIDEAGRGAWAGPVAAGAVCLPPPSVELSDLLAGVRDSKTMTARQRGILVERIKAVAVAWGVGSASSLEIDKNGINPAIRLAMTHALEMLMDKFPDIEPDCLFLDSIKWEDAPVACKQEHIVRGDQKSLSIAAASVLAKTWRDEFMRDLDEQFPGYGFGSHKGYGTARHIAALQTLGVAPVHRTYYRPIKAMLAGKYGADGEYD